VPNDFINGLAADFVTRVQCLQEACQTCQTTSMTEDFNVTCQNGFRFRDIDRSLFSALIYYALLRIFKALA